MGRFFWRAAVLSVLTRLIPKLYDDESSPIGRCGYPCSSRATLGKGIGALCYGKERKPWRNWVPKKNPPSCGFRTTDELKKSSLFLRNMDGISSWGWNRINRKTSRTWKSCSTLRNRCKSSKPDATIPAPAAAERSTKNAAGSSSLPERRGWRNPEYPGPGNV